MRKTRGFWYSFTLAFRSVAGFLAWLTTVFAMCNFAIDIFDLRISYIAKPLINFFRRFSYNIYDFFERYFGCFYPTDFNNNFISLTIILITICVKFMITAPMFDHWFDPNSRRSTAFEKITQSIIFSLFFLAYSSAFCLIILGLPIFRWFTSLTFYIGIFAYLFPLVFERKYHVAGFFGGIPREKHIRRLRFAGFLSGCVFGAVIFLTLNYFY